MGQQSYKIAVNLPSSIEAKNKLPPSIKHLLCRALNPVDYSQKNASSKGPMGK
jgi:hypothetical protein